jgi:hypothetical protein
MRFTPTMQVIGLEKALHYFWEERIQHFFLRWPDFVRFWNVYYWVAHGSNTIGALLALFFIRPGIYQVSLAGSRIQITDGSWCSALNHLACMCMHSRASQCSRVGLRGDMPGIPRTASVHWRALKLCYTQLIAHATSHTMC